MNNDRYTNTYPSVTQVLGILRKIGLEMWFKFNTSKFCDEKSERGKLIGKQIHQVFHDYIETGEAKLSTEYGEEVKTALKSFILFRKEHPDYELKNAEIKMTSEKHKCNGTLDCFAEKKGKAIILDWKSTDCGKKEKPVIYPEYFAQTAAYVNFYNEINKSNIKEAAIVSLAKNKVVYTHYEMNEQEISDYFNEMFLPALKIYNFQKRKKEV